MVAKTEQIRSLLLGDACTLVEKTVPKSELSCDSYSRVFTITKRDIVDYVAKHGLPAGAIRYRSAERDGVYMVRSVFGHSVYDQERGIISNKHFFFTQTAAINTVIDRLIALSGTGLTFE